MKLKDIIREPKKCWAYMERYVNDGSPSGFTKINPISKQYLPIEGKPEFHLPLLELPKEQVISLRTEHSLIDGSEYLRGDKILFPIHPDLVVNPQKYDGLMVQPTSSSRTVGLNGLKHFIKLHYPYKIGRAPREINETKVRECYAFTSEFEELEEVLAQQLPFFGYLSESFFLINKKTDMGVIFRESEPKPISEDSGRIIVPMFSMFSRDICVKNDPLLLDQIMQCYNSNNRFFNELIEPIMKTYLQLAFFYGIVNEWQAQNMLMELDSNGRFKRVLTRDFIDSYCDIDVRKSRGLAVREGIQLLAKEKKGEQIYFGKHSYLFDFKLGEYIFSPLCNAFATYSGSKIEEVNSSVRDIFWKVVHDLDIGKEARDYFSPFDEMYYFNKVEDIYKGLIPQFSRKKGLKYR